MGLGFRIGPPGINVGFWVTAFVVWFRSVGLWDFEVHKASVWGLAGLVWGLGTYCYKLLQSL